MLQGHFTDTLLADAFRDPDNLFFSTWKYLRGMTAPLFFFASGLIFTFLLLKDGRPLSTNKRVHKGLRRGLQLIIIGYALRLCFPQLLTGYISPNLFRVDVLHCIGLALIGLVALYALSRWSRLPYHLLLVSAGGLAFFFYFEVRDGQYASLPIVLPNYLVSDHGSVFGRCAGHATALPAKLGISESPARSPYHLRDSNRSIFISQADGLI